MQTHVGSHRQAKSLKLTLSKTWAYVLTVSMLPTANPLHAQTTQFEPGQQWACTTDQNGAPDKGRISFVVVGVTTSREISRRPSFQNDDLVISVAIVNRDPQVCARARHFLHMAFNEDALQDCLPVLVAQETSASDAFWESVLRAREDWVLGMSLDQGVVIGLHPSHFLGMLAQDRC